MNASRVVPTLLLPVAITAKVVFALALLDCVHAVPSSAFCHRAQRSRLRRTASKTFMSSNYFRHLPNGGVDRLGRWRDRWRDDYDSRPSFHLDGVNPNLRRFHHGGGTSIGNFCPPRSEPVLVPLCGKTVDLAWLRDIGGHGCVVGVEGVTQAVEELQREGTLPGLRRIDVEHRVVIGGDDGVDSDARDEARRTTSEVWTTAGEDRDWFRPRRRRLRQSGVGDAASATQRPVSAGLGVISVVRGDFFELSPSLFAPSSYSDGNGDVSRVPPFGAVYDRAALVAVPPASRADYVAKVDELLRPGGQILLVTIDRPEGDDNVGPPFRVTPSTVDGLYRPRGYQVRLVEEHPTEIKGSTTSEYVFVLTKGR